MKCEKNTHVSGLMCNCQAIRLREAAKYVADKIAQGMLDDKNWAVVALREAL